MTEEIKEPSYKQGMLISLAGVSLATFAGIPCSVYLKRGEDVEVLWDLEVGDMLCVIRKRNIK